MSAQSFEDLWIWRQARELVRCIYYDCSTISSLRHDYSFRDQLQRAGISVMNNIAEGFDRDSDAEFARFLSMARGSAGEVRSMYYAAEDLKYIFPEVATERRRAARRISSAITMLQKHLRNKPPP